MTATPMLVVTPRPLPLNAARWSRTASTSLSATIRARSSSACGQDHGELVTAQAGEDVRLAHLLPQELGDAPDDGVAGVVAEAVVDELEIVEVEQQHRPALAVSSRLREPVDELLLEAAAV